MIIEAMAQARPVIATHTGGIADVIQDHVTGRLVEPANPEQLAGAIRDLHEFPVEASAIGQRGAALVRSRFDWTHTLDGFDDLYRRTIGGRR